MTTHFGNRVELVSVSGGEKTIRIMASGEVDTEERNGVFGPHLGYVPLWLFRRDTALTKPGKAIRELAKSIEGEGELAKMHALMGWLNQNVEYNKDGDVVRHHGRTGDRTEGRRLSGSRAHFHIDGARHGPRRPLRLRLHARRQRNGRRKPRLGGSACPGLGWVGFDPTNDICPDERYVRIATGLDYADTAPVSGMRVGTAPEMIIVSVSVEQEQ